MPHHVSQRGNRRQEPFFRDDDYQAYPDLMAESCGQHKVEVWGYCLMPNHVHLIVVPKSEDGLRWAIGKAHRRYTRRVDYREKWRGHLWQGRFASFVLDEPYLLAAARCVELNPARAKLVTAPSVSASANSFWCSRVRSSTIPLILSCSRQSVAQHRYSHRSIPPSTSPHVPSCTIPCQTQSAECTPNRKSITAPDSGCGFTSANLE